MAGKPGRSGRPAGSVAETTRLVREAVARFAQENVGNMGEWLKQIEDPAKRLDLFLRALEYHIPKVQRTELTGAGGGAIQVQAATFKHLSDAELEQMQDMLARSAVQVIEHEQPIVERAIDAHHVNSFDLSRATDE